MTYKAIKTHKGPEGDDNLERRGNGSLTKRLTNQGPSFGTLPGIVIKSQGSKYPQGNISSEGKWHFRA